MSVVTLYCYYSPTLNSTFVARVRFRSALVCCCFDIRAVAGFDDASATSVLFFHSPVALFARPRPHQHRRRGTRRRHPPLGHC